MSTVPLGSGLLPFLRRAGAIARKELRHILREPRTLLVVFIQPVLLLLLYGYCISFDLHRIPFAVWDQDRTEPARQLVRRLHTSGETTFTLSGYASGPKEVDRLLAAGRVRFVLVIPSGFGRDMTAGRTAKLQALFDGADSNTAGVASGYLAASLAEYNTRQTEIDAVGRPRRTAALRAAGPAIGGAASFAEPISLRWRVFYNPDLSSRRFIVPGLIAILVTFLATALTSTTITRERELGPLEALLTSPATALDVVIGKMSPYVLVAAGTIALVLVTGGLVFNVWPRGNLLTITSFSFLFVLGLLSIGMLISALAPTQQLALLFSALSTTLPTLFLTGFIFRVGNMPPVIQLISSVLPATQYLIALRGVFLKGTGWSVLWPQGLFMGCVAFLMIAIAVGIVRIRMARGLE